MIDSTDASVMEEALKRSPGKCVLNSINLEDGEERFETVVPLLHSYGAALVVGTIDEDKKMGMALTRARKLGVAQRSFDLLVEKYGLAPEDLIFDPLVFPAGTGDKNYWGSAVETIEGVRLIKEALPRCRTVLGVSNVSFGLPPAGREVLNSVFLHHCVEAGLDLAIVNAEKLARYSQIPDEEKTLAWNLLSWKGPGDPAHPAGFDAVAAFSDHFRAAKVVEKSPSERLKRPIDERLAAQHRRRLDGGARRRPRRAGQGAQAARDHQRSADERHGRSRPPVRRQRDDRRRGAAVGRGHEGRGRAPRAAHGPPPTSRRAARSCSPPSRATCTTSARTSCTSS